jgi:N-ethylmaleimide reductase
MPTLDLFTPLQVGPLNVPNRIFMAPMTRNRAGTGNVPTDLMATYYQQRASAGLIITEATQVSPQGVGYPGTPGLHSNEQVEGWKRITAAVHAKGGRIFSQLWHVGRISHSSLQPNGSLPVAPSAIPAGGQVYTLQGMKPYETPRALETAEISGIVEDFHRAAQHAKTAGFDGVELHGANGYLPDQFLRDGTNRRTDRYGGAIENRARFHLECMAALIDVWGSSRVGVRLSPSGTFNDMSDSNPKATFTYLATELNKLNLAYLHIIEGGESDIRHGGPGYEAIHASFFRPIFKNVLVGNNAFTLEKAQTAITAGSVDAVAFGIPFLANPDLPARFQSRASLNTPDQASFYGGTEKGYTDYPALA